MMFLVLPCELGRIEAMRVTGVSLQRYQRQPPVATIQIEFRPRRTDDTDTGRQLGGDPGELRGYQTLVSGPGYATRGWRRPRSALLRMTSPASSRSSDSQFPSPVSANIINVVRCHQRSTSRADVEFRRTSEFLDCVVEPLCSPSRLPSRRRFAAVDPR